MKKIHKVVSFDQEPFLKSYIEKLTKLRIMYVEKNNTFFANVFKLLANSTYGKFAENPHNYNYSKLCLNPLQFKKAISSPRFITAIIINENVAIVQYKPSHLIFKSAYHVAAAILELSKLYMTYFLYDILKPHFYPDKINIMLSDTDSFIFEIKCRNFFKRYKTLQMMDFSNFPKNHYLYSNENKKSLFHFKDENPFDYISQFCGLRPKLYAIKTVNDQNYIRSKGYSKNFSKTFLSFDTYKECHNTLQDFRFPFKSIRGYDHHLFSILQNKIVLSNFDSKMYCCDCNIHTFFHGSIDAQNKCEKCNNNVMFYHNM